MRSRRFARVGLVALAALLVAGLMAPSTAAAEDSRQNRADIRILSDDDFTEANGVRSGSGTAEDPYEISGWNVNNLYIKDTSAHVVIHDNTVRSRMTLDWIGRGVEVHHNDVWDLRVNQNVRRTGDATSGVIADNTFRQVGQLRHWDGAFEDNVVGDPATVTDPLGEIFARRAVNFDGFNGARFRNNTIYGYVDARLHGHHHSSGFGDDSHHHGVDSDMDHGERYHEVWITGNRIEVHNAETHALAYLDTNHAANDRTATSEENPALNDPHVHYTRVHVTDNELIGSGLRVDVFNANDARHLDTARGVVRLERNSVMLHPYQIWGAYSTKHGIYARTARDVDLWIRSNSVMLHSHGQSLPTLIGGGAGVYLDTFDIGAVRIYDNAVTDLYYGVYATRFTDSVDWFVDGLATTGVDRDVYASSTVRNAPQDRSADPTPDHDYDEDEDDEDDEDGDGHDH